VRQSLLSTVPQAVLDGADWHLKGVEGGTAIGRVASPTYRTLTLQKTKVYTSPQTFPDIIQVFWMPDTKRTSTKVPTPTRQSSRRKQTCLYGTSSRQVRRKRGFKDVRQSLNKHSRTSFPRRRKKKRELGREIFQPLSRTSSDVGRGAGRGLSTAVGPSGTLVKVAMYCRKSRMFDTVHNPGLCRL